MTIYLIILNGPWVELGKAQSISRQFWGPKRALHPIRVLKTTLNLIGLKNWITKRTKIPWLNCNCFKQLSDLTDSFDFSPYQITSQQSKYWLVYGCWYLQLLLTMNSLKQRLLKNIPNVWNLWRDNFVHIKRHNDFFICWHVGFVSTHTSYISDQYF